MSDEKFSFIERYRKCVPLPSRDKLVEVNMNAWLRQLHYAELEMRVMWYALAEFQRAYPEKVTVTPPDCVEFHCPYEEFQEFCKTLGNEQRSK